MYQLTQGHTINGKVGSGNQVYSSWVPKLKHHLPLNHDFMALCSNLEIARSEGYGL